MGYVRTETSPTKGKRYVARWYDDAGVQRRQTFSRKADAEAHVRRMEGDKERGHYHDPNSGKVLYRTVASEWLDTLQVGKEKTKLGYESLLNNHVLPTFENTPVGRITKANVKTWVAERNKAGVGAGTIRNAYRNVLKPSLDHAVDVGYLVANPALAVKLPTSDADEEQLFLTPEQVLLLADEITPQYRSLILFAAYTGLRAGEIAGLRIKNLDLLHRIVKVRESASDLNGHLTYTTPKTKTSKRDVPLPAPLDDLLAALIAPYASDKEAFVFRSPDGGPLRHGNFYARHYLPAVARLIANGSFPSDLTALRFHDLRHTAAAIMIDLAGADPYNIMRRLGHSSISVTFDTYGHRFPKRDAEITRGLEAAFARAAATQPEPDADVVALR